MVFRDVSFFLQRFCPMVQVFLLVGSVNALVPSSWTVASRAGKPGLPIQHDEGKLLYPRILTIFASNEKGDSSNDDVPVNRYQDPNYPDLEFLNYDDPEYQVDMGIIPDELFSVEEEIERMREDRRLQNDEYQFQTYYSKTCANGAEWMCDWTIYQATYDNPNAVPVLRQMRPPLQVKTRASMEEKGGKEKEHIVHHEAWDSDDSDFNWDSYYKPCWPSQLRSIDFRGHQGIMICGNSWTICTATPAVAGAITDAAESYYYGPFTQYQAEVGIHEDDLRFRVKLHYKAHANGDETNQVAPLLLEHLTISRETKGDSVFPRETSNMIALEAMFGVPGADGGLYDPPPVDEPTIPYYMKLDLPGHATVLLPYRMDQHEDERVTGWVTSLDWTPSSMRYQVDRKVGRGSKLLGLRSLELSEVQSADAETYRPRDGGQNMRQ